MQKDNTLSAAEDSPSTSQAEATALPGMAVMSSSQPLKRSAMAELFGSFFKVEERNQTNLKHQLQEEVSGYMAKDCTSVDSDHLAWWKTHESVYPNLAVLAKSYLAIPATLVPSERMFSTAGDIVTANKGVQYIAVQSVMANAGV